MAIKPGDRVPDATFTRMTDAGPTPAMEAEVFSSKRIVLVDDGVVKELNVLNPGEHKVSDAEFTVCQL